MAKSLLIAGNVQVTTQNTTQYTFITGINILGSTEAPKQIPFRDAGVISKLGLRVLTNTTSTNTIVRLRKNGVNGNQSITISGGQTGEIIDNTNTDSVAAGDKIAIQIVTPNTGTITFDLIAAIYEPTDNTITTTRLLIGNPVSHNASTIFYGLLQGDLDLDITATTEHRILPRVAGVFKHWAMYSSVGGRAVACRMLKNGAEIEPITNLILLNTDVTGLGENTVSSISSNTTDDFTNLWVFGGSGTSRTLDFIATSFVNTGPYSLILGGQSDGYFRGPGTDYHKIGSYFVASLTESEMQIKARSDFILSKLTVRITNNTINSGTSTFTLRKNGVDTALSVSIAAGANGTFTDTTDSVTVGPDDLISYKFTISGTTGTLGLTWASLVAEGVANTGPVDMDVTDTIVLTNKFITKV